jgi:hypothetical protein
MSISTLNEMVMSEAKSILSRLVLRRRPYNNIFAHDTEVRRRLYHGQCDVFD